VLSPISHHRYPLLFWDVDTQIDFMLDSGKLYVPGADRLPQNLEQLTAAAARHRIPVVASADDHAMEDAEISLQPDFRSTYPPHCMRGTHGAERIPATRQTWTLEVGHESLPAGRLEEALATDAPRILIHKKSVDVFSNPNTDGVLKALDPARVVVYGVALDICNRMAIDGLLARGRAVTLVTDASRPLDVDRAAGLVADWRRHGVGMATTQELIDSLRADRPSTDLPSASA